VENGAIAEVRDSQGEFLCYAMVNTRAYISGRVISFEQEDPMVTLKKKARLD